mgnify:CR=1 FL=1
MKELLGEISRLNKILERIWLQKSRVSWATQGDRNTRYYLIITCNRNIRNSLCSVMMNDVMVEEPMEVRQVVMSHFKNHFSESWADRPKLSGQFKNIEGSQAAELLEV